MPTITRRFEFDAGVACRAIEDFPGYLIGEDGTVWSRWGKGSRIKIGRMSKSWKKLKAWLGDDAGHLMVTLFNCHGGKYLYVHRLVLEAFVGACPKGQQCRHLDGNPGNNHLGNLCWGTQKENEEDKIRHGTKILGEMHKRARITDTQAVQIRKMYATGRYYMRELAKIFNTDISSVCMIIHRQLWKHV